MITPETHHFVAVLRSKARTTQKGTEAAAVTGVAAEYSIEHDRPKPFEMIVDRPFLFLIHDSRTGMILFAGRVVEM